jgi:hypothetical protein
VKRLRWRSRLAGTPRGAASISLPRLDRCLRLDTALMQRAEGREGGTRKDLFPSPYVPYLLSYPCRGRSGDIAAVNMPGVLSSREAGLGCVALVGIGSCFINQWMGKDKHKQ